MAQSKYTNSLKIELATNPNLVEQYMWWGVEGGDEGSEFVSVLLMVCDLTRSRAAVLDNDYRLIGTTEPHQQMATACL